MKINKYEDITGAVTVDEIPEGRMCLVVASSESNDFGSWGDLPGVRVPKTSAEAAKAHYCVTFAVDNTVPPIYQPYPTIAGGFALRQGFDKAKNVPFTADIYLSSLSVQVGLTIPSGMLCLAFGEGVYTVASGEYVYSASLVPGADLEVANETDDGASLAGMLQYSASVGFAEVVRVDDELNLTFRITK